MFSRQPLFQEGRRTISTHPQPAGPDPPHAHTRLLDGLTPEQAQAVCHGTGPLLLLAGPGAGKTRTLIHRIARLLETGLAQPWQILAVTFSVRAASELRLRLADLLGESAARPVTASTFHSVCARVLREHARLVGRTDSYTIYDQTEVRKVIEWLLSDSQRTEIQHALATHGRPAATEIQHEISLAKNQLLTPEAYQHTARHPAAPLITHVWRQTDTELRRSNAVEFDDMLVLAVRLLGEHPHIATHYRQRWQWLMVDEFQDTNQAQATLVQQLAGPNGNVSCVGDDDQCLVEGTRVTMADGSRKPIETIRTGDLVLSASGGGRRAPARVTAVRSRSRADGVAITMASGRTLVSTPEHMHFAGYRLGLTPQTFFVYLMHREGTGFRIGTTSVYTKSQKKPIVGLKLRCIHERADAAWVISTHDSATEARLAELVISLRYGLPTLPLVARKRAGDSGGGLVQSQKLLDRAFAMLDTETGAKRLMADHGLSGAHPHHLAQSSEGRRRILIVTLCGGNHGHRLSLSGYDETVAGRLRSAGYRPKFGKTTSPRHWDVEVHRSDLGELLAHAERISTLTGARIRHVGNVGGGINGLAGSLPVIPACSVRPGMVMATETGGHDVVLSVTPVALAARVFDLDVDGTHNFVANGLVTHNCVYAFRGAEPGNMLDFQARFPAYTRIVLGRNFRSRAEILQPAARCVAHNPKRWPKALVAMRGAGGQTHVLGFADEREEAAWAAATIRDALNAGVPASEVLVLARTGFASDPAQRALAHAGIPHRVLGSLGLYERAEVRDALAYLTLVANPRDAQAFRRSISAPKRGIGPTAAGHVIATAREHHSDDLIAASTHGESITAIRSAAARAALTRFGQGLERARQEQQAGRSVAHVTLTVLMIAGGPVRYQQHRRDQHPEAEHREDAERALEDLRSLARAANTYSEQQPDGTLTGFLEQACGLHAQQMQPGEPDRRITISSIHRAKGTEATLVILLACEDRLLPSWRAIENSDLEALCEERRLFYVAATRAKDTLLISHAARRGRRPTAGPSRFLTEAGLTTPQALAA